VKPSSPARFLSSFVVKQSISLYMYFVRGRSRIIRLHPLQVDLSRCMISEKLMGSLMVIIVYKFRIDSLASLGVAFFFVYTSWYFSVLQNLSIKMLSTARFLPSMCARLRLLRLRPGLTPAIPISLMQHTTCSVLVRLISN